MNLFPGVASFLDKASALLTESAEKSREDAKRQEAFAAIAADPALREKLNRILAEASFLGLDVLSRVKTAATPTPKAKPAPEPEKPKTRSQARAESETDKADALLDSIFGSVPSFEGFHAIDLGAVDPDSDLGRTLKGIIDKINKSEKRGDDLPPF